jgi:hypothetical protein
MLNAWLYISLFYYVRLFGYMLSGCNFICYMVVGLMAVGCMCCRVSCTVGRMGYMMHGCR